MGDIFGTLIKDITEHMNYRTYRQEVISGNIANVNTPGYKAKEALFDRELRSRLHLVATNPAHLKASRSEPLYTTVVDPYARIGNDGNTVDIDREMMKLNQNHLLYSASAEI
ncbi:MAG TPA: flagellar basal body rod protein FlgB, partial [Deltaproteobacteria bacterium]|nr:flagellar basal body rod protein FlgB [Deltaproteobacteria bacterium]